MPEWVFALCVITLLGQCAYLYAVTKGNLKLMLKCTSFMSFMLTLLICNFFVKATSSQPLETTDRRVTAFALIGVSVSIVLNPIVQQIYHMMAYAATLEQALTVKLESRYKPAKDELPSQDQPHQAIYNIHLV